MGTDYYVADSDGNPAYNGRFPAFVSGSNGPKKTVAEGIALLDTLANITTATTTGDTIHVRTGTYTPYINSAKKGASWNVPITLQAYSGEVVTLTTGNGDTIVDFVSSVYPVAENWYWIFKDLVFDATGLQSGIGGVSDNYVRMNHCEVKNAQSNGILPHGDYWEFINMIVHNNGAGGSFGHGMYLTGTHNTVTGGSYYSNLKFGIQIYDAVSTDVSYNTVSKARIYSNNTLNIGAGGIIISSGTNNIVYDCLIYNNNGDGVEIASSGTVTTGNKVFNNTIYNNTNNGVNISAPSSGAIVQNNIILSNGTTILNNGASTTQDHNITTGTVASHFTNAGGADFTLVAGSSIAIDAGIDLSAYFSDDFLGAVRPAAGSAGWDCGAYESGGTVPTPTPGGDGVFSKITFSSLAADANGTTSMGPTLWNNTGHGSSRSFYGCILYKIGSTYYVSIYGISSGALVLSMTADTSTTWTTGDTLELWAEGSNPVTLTAKKNMATLMSTTDSVLANTGNYGFAMDGTSDAVVDAWEAGLITAGVTSTVTMATFNNTTALQLGTNNGWYQQMDPACTLFYTGSGGVTATPRTSGSGAGLDFAAAVWGSPNPQYIRPLVVTASQVTGTQTNYPSLVTVTDATLSGTANGGHVYSSSGHDILFYADIARSSLLNWEMERYTVSTGAVIAHVKIPTLTTTTTIYMAYSDPALISAQGSATSTWTNGFNSVYHFSNGTTLSLADSSANAYTATNHSGTAVTGKVDGGLGLNGTNQYVDAGAGANKNYGTGTFTVEALFATSTGTGHILRRITGGTVIYMRLVTGGFIQGVSNGAVTGNVNLADSAYHYAVMTRQTTTVSVYVDGVFTGSSSAGLVDFTTGNSWFIGSNEDPAEYFGGTLDEVRFSNQARSATWISTSYNNLTSPTTFWTLGTEVFVGAATPSGPPGSGVPNGSPLYPCPTDRHNKHMQFQHRHFPLQPVR